MLEEIEREFEGILLSIEPNMVNNILTMGLLAAATRDLKQQNEFTDDDQCKYLLFPVCCRLFLS